MVSSAGSVPTRSEFSEVVGNVFRATFEGDRSFDALLVSLDELVVNDDQENYALTFRAPNTVEPVQRVFDMRHETLGDFELFMVPVRADTNDLYFEAIINILHK